MKINERIQQHPLNGVCVVADCHERARTAFVADADGHLAGRWWWRGGFIDFCTRHAAMLYDGKDPAA